MSSGDGDTGRPVKFDIRLVPYAQALRAIGADAERDIDPKALAAEIREHGIGNMPAEVVDYLCRYLAGEIETRGRKGHKPVEQKLLGQRARLLYLGIRRSQAGDPDAVPEITSLLHAHEEQLRDIGISDSDIAWRLVSILLFGQPGHHKKLRNLVSKEAPLTK